ncbi:hypothetical protein KUCAC02_006325 [Chaenocephalus aceratus]|uniref:Uncharacterized protein n=1 Tax=Chaenocephalus aceratus TaxID=36190 RepID=A0ACB9VSE9_CHAAC|nr:hypothetical protein KUCAC02_006325 [Chaenocephalus aceratus]
MLTGRQQQGGGRQPDVAKGRGVPLLPSRPPQPHPSLAPLPDSSPNPQHASRVLGISISPRYDAINDAVDRTKESSLIVAIVKAILLHW